MTSLSSAATIFLRCQYKLSIALGIFAVCLQTIFVLLPNERVPSIRPLSLPNFTTADWDFVEDSRNIVNHIDGVFAYNCWAEPAIIHATSQSVFSVLSDFEKYGIWNPFTPKVRTDPALRMHQPVILSVAWGPYNLELSSTPQTDALVDIQQEEYLSFWKKDVAMAWGFQWSYFLAAERAQILIPSDGGAKTVYVCVDRFSGILSPIVLWIYGDAMANGFTAAGRALKMRVEEIGEPFGTQKASS